MPHCINNKVFPFLLPYRRVIPIILCCLLAAMGVVAQKPEQRPLDVRLSHYSSLSDNKLMKLGYEFMESGKADDAIICYTIVVDRNKEEKIDRKKAEVMIDAYNNIGYLNQFQFFNYSKAYSSLNEALKLAEFHNIKGKKPAILINLAGLLVLGSDIGSGTLPSRKVMELYDQAAENALAEKNWGSFNTIINNLIHIYLTYSLHDELTPQLDRWMKSGVPSSAPMFIYTKAHCHAARELINGNLPRAIQHYGTMEMSLPDSPDKSRYKMALEFEKGIAFGSAERYSEAINQLHEAEKLSLQNGDHDVRVSAYYLLTEYLNKNMQFDEAQDYYMKYLQLKDTLMRRHSLVKVEHMRFLDELEKADTIIKEKEYQRQKILTFSVSLAVVLSFFILVMMVMARKNRQLRDKNKSLYELNRRLNSAGGPTSAIPVAAPHGPGSANGREPAKSSPEEETPARKYRNSTLDEKAKAEIAEAVMKVMNDSETLCSENFSLTVLAEKIGCKSGNVSQVIGENLGKNFNTLVSEFRVMEACRRFDDEEHYGNYSIEGIAISVGFKSRSNFAQNFKRVTGLTPSEYQQNARERRKQDKSKEDKS